jgi:hypothetical protein
MDFNFTWNFLTCSVTGAVIKKRQNAKQGKIEITHMNTTKGTGTQKQQSTENKNVHE